MNPTLLNQHVLLLVCSWLTLCGLITRVQVPPHEPNTTQPTCIITSGMLHHPGVSLSECLQSTCKWPHMGGWHAAILISGPVGSATMARQGQVPHSNCELHSIQRVSSCVWVVKLVVHVWCLLETSVTHTQPCHVAIWLTEYRSYCVCCECIQLESSSLPVVPSMPMVQR